jgi:hypothetical protein
MKTLSYRSLLKSKIKNINEDENQLDNQIYSCAFQVVLHPETFEPVIVWLNPDYLDIDDVIILFN